MEPRTPSETAVTLTQVMNPEHANPLGNVHGGWILKLIDEAGSIVASRHARHPAVTVEIDSVSFREPVYVGNLVHVQARIVRAWRTSMEVEAIVEAEDPLTGERRITSHAYLVYVALDRAGRPTPVPPVQPETEEEWRKWHEAEQRRAERLARRERERLSSR
ncbi:MAG: acyl-CoA thioesterase [Fimbriimonadales bacterium]|nr:acyl-CoA thioesterase [Fimbriimonadales bacterium]MDW8051007.1 acyl-CoA thioesterase [Armatimonadota bacterium]